MEYPYSDFRSYIDALDSEGLVTHVYDPINKDTEMIPLVRLQFRGLEESKRKTFLFHNVIGSGGKVYEGKVVVGALAASRSVYHKAVGGDVSATWKRALENHIKPVTVETGPVKECIIKGEELDSGHGIDLFPHPISTPGYDPAPFLTSPYWVTKDPETGIYNVGTYRGMLKENNRVGLQMDTPLQHIAIHLEKARKLGLKTLEAAVVLGAVPAIGLASVTKLPFGVSEYDVAGGIMGKPVELVPCETIDLEVPHNAEIVLEGEIDLTELEEEGPFGEASGYMGPRGLSPYMKIKAITHRKNPVYQAFISEFPPSESTLMRKMGFENVYTNFLQNSCKISSVKKVAFHEMGTCNMTLVIQMDSPAPGQAMQALYAATSYEPSMGKIIIAVDSDVDPEDMDSVIWALSFSMQPSRDVQIIKGKLPRLDPSSNSINDTSECSALLIDATRPYDYPPTSLPSQKYMEDAVVMWEKLGLPKLDLKEPWFGYELGDWTEENKDEAKLAVLGKYFETGKKLYQRRVPFQKGT
ncbi:hypothetical protein BTR23_25200 [Alkalihalophilus pseudofirmus]|nr:hypothetical protein BTR23_25200 [Alkalihalophilus pseudofirmus]